jgi:hypothetical protein
VPTNLLDPLSLGIKGSTQPELFEGTVQAMVRELQNDPDRFWREALARDGPLEIWEINGERFLFNGNHRWHAAVAAGAFIPASSIRIVPNAPAGVPTFLLQSMTRLPGMK